MPPKRGWSYVGDDQEWWIASVINCCNNSQQNKKFSPSHNRMMMMNQASMNSRFCWQESSNRNDDSTGSETHPSLTRLKPLSSSSYLVNTRSSASRSCPYSGCLALLRDFQFDGVTWPSSVLPFMQPINNYFRFQLPLSLNQFDHIFLPFNSLSFSLLASRELNSCNSCCSWSRHSSIRMICMEDSWTEWPI